MLGPSRRLRFGLFGQRYDFLGRTKFLGKAGPTFLLENQTVEFVVPENF
jgi:hypothetical protein